MRLRSKKSPTVGKRDKSLSPALKMNSRSHWQGMFTIVRFNWPVYLAATLAIIASLAGILLLARLDLKIACAICLVVATCFSFSSLVVSHLIYDRSDLYCGSWLERALCGTNIRVAIFCHCGFDDGSPALRSRFADAHWQILDHFDQKQMTESSIRRARAICPPTPGTVPARYDAWPVSADSA